MKVRQWGLIFGFALVAMLGYWLASTAVPDKTVRKAPLRVAKPQAAMRADEPAPRFRRGERPPVKAGDPEAAALGALAGQRVLVFKDQAALLRFLERAGKGIQLLGRLDAINALRIGFSDYADLAALLDGAEEQSFIFPVNIPDLPQGSVQPGAVALGSHLLEWLGVTGDNSNWGKGALVAILDTGVAASKAFNTSITHINLVALPADLSQQNGHGTAMASLIIGNDPLAPGIAPASRILDVRIADDQGQSNTYLLAEGIIAAVDAGANPISISMGGFGESALMRNAIKYATDRGVVIVAAAGNNGMNQVASPANEAGVIAVGAVDARGNPLAFSNTGEPLDIAAPGYGVNVALPGNEMGSISGTSPATAIVSGVIAGVMTATSQTGVMSWNSIVTNANDSGPAGWDDASGAGMTNIGRVLDAGTPGIHDAAVTSQTILPADSGHPYGQVGIVVQNQGTETLINTAVNISTGGGVQSINLTSLAPGASTTVYVPVPQPSSPTSSGFTVDSRVVISGGLIDVKPSNDQRVETYVPAGAR
jgi:hypothetical protein